MGKLSHYSRGAAALLELFGQRKAPVPREVAIARAKICLQCPKNAPNHRLKAPMLATRKAWEAASGQDLSLEFDDKIGICRACDCLIGLKVHVDLDHILRWTSQETLESLPSNCWIMNP